MRLLLGDLNGGSWPELKIINLYSETVCGYLQMKKINIISLMRHPKTTRPFSFGKKNAQL